MTMNSHVPLVSVIVPVYNVEEHLRACLDSLLDQTLANLEIVAVDDGSPDGSAEILRHYASAHPDKIVHLTKSNGGLSDARNFGVRHARGRYIGFVDSDDRVEPTMFEDLSKAIVELDCDIAIGQYIHYGVNDKPSIQGKMRSTLGDVFHGREFLLSHVSMVVWNKLYRRELPEQHEFPITWFEDVAWTPVVMSHATRVCYVPKPFYHYVRREGSIASSHHDPRTLEGISAIKYALDHANPAERDAVAYMAARRLLFEIRIRKGYADHYSMALRSIREHLEASRYYLDDESLRSTVRELALPDQPIPRRLVLPHAGATSPAECLDAVQPGWHHVLVHGELEVVSPTPSGADDPEGVLIARLADEGHHRLLGQLLQLRAVVTDGGVAYSPELTPNAFITPVLANSGFFATDLNGEPLTEIYGAVKAHPTVAMLLDRFRTELEQGRRDPTLLAEVMCDVIGPDLAHAVGDRVLIRDDGLRVYPARYFHSRLDDSNVTELRPASPERGLPTDHQVVTSAYVDTLVREATAARREAERLTRRTAHLEQKLTELRESMRWRLVWRFKFLDNLGPLQLARHLVPVRRSLGKDSALRARARYARLLATRPVDPRLVLIESFYGRGMVSNPMALFLAWAQRTDFTLYRFAWVLDQPEKHAPLTTSVLEQYSNVSFVEKGSAAYDEMLATAGTLINDVTFYFHFVRRPEQRYINTWHSITVKSLGFDLPGNKLDQKNVVKNFLSTTHFVAANEWVRDDTLYRSHRMTGLFPGRVVFEGHPRTDLFFNANPSEVATKLQDAGVQFDPSLPTIVFAPTWRGTRIDRPTDDLAGYEDVVKHLRETLGTEQWNILVRLHQTAHQHLKMSPNLRDIAVPPTIDANEFLSVVDVLITDYSSIFFDFLVSSRPILFYLPDLHEYRANRGVYFRPEELPGPVYRDPASLASAASTLDLAGPRPDKYEAMAAWACPKDDGSVSERVLSAILDGPEPRPDPGPAWKRPRVLLYGGNLDSDAEFTRTEAAAETFAGHDYDVSVLVDDQRTPVLNQRVESLLRRDLRVLGRSGHTVFTPCEHYLLAVARSLPGRRWLARLLQRAVKREWRRCVGAAEFDLVVNLAPGDELFDLMLARGHTSNSSALLTTPAAPRRRRRRQERQRSRYGYHSTLFSQEDVARLARRVAEGT